MYNKPANMNGYSKPDQMNKIISPIQNGARTVFTALRSYFFTGILIVIPVFVTVFILAQMFNIADGLLGNFIRKMVGLPLPGIGLISTALVCIAAGMIGQNVFGKRIFQYIDASLKSIPLVSPIYVGLQQVAEAVFKDRHSEFKRVVLVEYPRDNCWAIGFVTNDFTFPAKGRHFTDKPTFSVFIPTTPNPTSGLLVIVEKSRVTDTSIGIEEAMKIVISGGLVQRPSIGYLEESHLTLAAKSDDEFTVPH